MGKLRKDEMIDQDEINKIMATKPPSFSMKVLRPLANLTAHYTSPSQICSLLQDFGFSEVVNNPAEAETVLLKVFETLRDEKNDKDIKEIIEGFLTLYGRLIDERLHDTGFVGQAREILLLGHFSLGFHPIRKTFLILPFDGPVHGNSMRVDGTTEKDFQDPKKVKMRTVATAQKDSAGGLFMFTLNKNGVLARMNPLPGDIAYPMEKNSRRHKVLKELASLKNNNFCKTKDLAELVGCEEGEFRKTCGEIKAQIISRFSGIKATDVIDSKKNSGYRINPKARIIEVS